MLLSTMSLVIIVKKCHQQNKKCTLRSCNKENNNLLKCKLSQAQPITTGSMRYKRLRLQLIK